MNVLAIGAHPDDIEIFMFGTLAALAARGDQLAYVIVTDGTRGGRGAPGHLRATRKAEAEAAAGLLNADLHFLDLPDGELVADATLVKALKGAIERASPDLIITHAANDYHGDHRALSEGVRIAASFAAPVLHCDTLRGVGASPTHYVDITAHVEAKDAAIRCHASQDPDRFVSASRVLSAFRASQANAPEGSHAEAFRFEPVFPFVDIRDLLPKAPMVRPVVNRASVSRG
ncbi:PIG-L deacetylase family protein [Devosia beringensis]|uniref:PIG-L deacetylase family protein n=1 Tax=Devosia beringensis TaxID=2657486 RepID=UPI00186B96AC|nr:PIG-L deacetylase family protein [Devosia beringensis]